MKVSRLGVILLSIGLVLSIVIAGTCISYARSDYSFQNLVKDVRQVSNDILPGDAPNFMNTDAIRAFGYGTCGEYNKLLGDVLAKKGVFSRGLTIGTYDGRIHALLEVRIGDNWILTNPMIGIVYSHNTYALFENPQLANEFQGDLHTDRGAYYGVDFFSDIAYVYNPIQYDEMTNVPQDLIEHFVYENNGQKNQIANNSIELSDRAIVNLEWTNALNPKYIYFSVSKDAQVRLIDKKDQSYTTLLSSEDRGLYLNEMVQEEGSIQVEIVNNSKENIEVSINLLANREDVQQLAEVFSPLESYISFTGGRVDLDKLSISCEGVRVFSLDIGNLYEERQPSKFLYSNEFFGSDIPTNTWGPILLEGDRDFRTAGFYNKESVNKQAAILVRPLLKNIKIANSCELSIDYKHSIEDEEAAVNFFDPRKQSYELLGTVPFSNKWTRVDYPLDIEILHSLAGNSKFFDRG